MRADRNRLLAKGQVWKTRAAAIEIVALGKRLICYKITKQSGMGWVSAQVSAIEAMEEYLRRNAAKLVPGVSGD